MKLMSTKRYYILIPLLLLVIGLLVHKPSFNLSLYGDDWLSIYNCLGPAITHKVDPYFTGPLPGILTYLTAYGPTDCLIGLQYLLFGREYQWYYIISLALKIFVSFCFFLLIKDIFKGKLKVLAFLSAVLLLVGYTGIQNTDWAVYMIVYLSTGLFLLSLLFKNKYLIYNKSQYLVISFCLLEASLILLSIRLFPIIFFIPMMDLLIIFSRIYKVKYSRIIISDFLFVFSIFLFWLAGLFGLPGKIYSYGGWSAVAFLDFVFNHPVESIKSLLYWISVVVVPDRWLNTNSMYLLIGFLIFCFFMGAVLQYIKIKNVDSFWLVISITGFLVFLLSMWYYSPSRLAGSGERYLFLPFTFFCFFIATLINQRFFTAHFFMKRLSIVLIVILIVVHWSAVELEYSNLLSHGRNSKFVNQFDNLLFKSLRLPVNSKNFIYLDFDDGFTEHSILFGLGFKIIVLSKIWNTAYDPDIYDEKNKFYEVVKQESSSNHTKDAILNHVFAFQLRNNSLTDISHIIRGELLKVISTNN